MSDNEQEITESDLLAYVDGEVQGARRDRVEQYLADNAAAAALVDEWREQNRRLGTLYGHAAAETVPDRLRARHLRPSQFGNRGNVWIQVAASVALVSLGIGSGWVMNDVLSGRGGTSQPLAALAVEAHDLFASEVMHPVEVRADESAHLEAWLSKRLDRKLSVPDLRQLGLSLVGGRLLPTARGEPAAQIMYEDAGGERLTLYVTAVSAAPETALHFSSVEGVKTVTWTDEDVNCVLVGNFPRNQLQAIAKTAYRQLI